MARTFLKYPEWRVRGITRNVSSEAAQALVKEGVEIVQGDLDDKTSLIQAFDGATAIFSNTDFFTHLFHAIGNPDVISAGSSACQYAYEREVAQGMNIAEAAEHPSVLKTLDHFILSSLADASKWSAGKYTSVYHFDSKAEMIRLTREQCPGVFAKMSTVQMGNYVTNWKAFAKMAPQKQADGSFLLTRTTPPDFKMPLFVAHEDTGGFVKATVDLPPGKDLMGVSAYMTLTEFMEIWGRVQGVRAAYKQISNEDFFEGLPGGLADELRDGFDFIHEFGFTGGDPNVLEAEQVRLESHSSLFVGYSLMNLLYQLGIKVPVTSMEEYIRNEDWSSIMSS